jgi:imidazolonepropionase-like amidohydrolase
MMTRISLVWLCILAVPAHAQMGPASEPPPPAIALVGGTIIDGRGGAPMPDATIVIIDGRIVAIGPRDRVAIPSRARQIDAAGRFITPGFIDVNVHLTPYNSFDNYGGPDSLLVLAALQGAREMLRHGITTARDTYGYLAPLSEARARLANDSLGATLLVAGNIIGWGGPWSFSFTGNTGSQPQSDYARKVRDGIVLGMGENLIEIATDSLALLINTYIDRGVDFVKLGVTTHFERPAYLLFSSRSIEAMVAAAHARGKKVDAHAGTVEALRMAALAGVDVLQHPEIVGGNLIPPVLAESLRARHAVCAMMPNRITGPEWARFQAHLAMGGAMWPPELPPALVAARADSLKRLGIDPTTRPRTMSVTRFQNERANAELLIRSGCTIAVASDDLVPSPSSTTSHVMGSVFLSGVEGLVEEGMTPSQALVAATWNGALAAGRERQIGSIAVGKQADLVVLEADPLKDIHNIRRLAFVVVRGHVVHAD